MVLLVVQWLSVMEKKIQIQKEIRIEGLFVLSISLYTFILFVLLNNVSSLENCPIAALIKKWCKEFSVDQKKFRWLLSLIEIDF